MNPHIYVCITTRDGNIRNDILAAVMQAANVAQQAGITVSVGRQQYQYGIATCRNKAVAMFLGIQKCSHLLFIDDDVILPADALIHFAESINKGLDIVCGCYPSLKFIGTTQAVLYVTITKLEPGKVVWYDEFPDGVIEVAGGGTGCMLISRNVLESIGHPWFQWPERYDETTGTIQCISDDMDFCERAAASGFRIWADGRIRCGHQKLVDVKSLMDGSIQWLHGRQPDAADAAWGSHVPALKAVAKLKPIKKVIEFGAGKYSTPLFLDRNAFPALQSLISFESDPEWCDDAKNRFAGDSRFSIQLVPLQSMSKLGVFGDLIFIDCDESNDGQHDFSERVKLIEDFQNTSHPIVVVHDCNFTQIAPAIAKSKYKNKRIYVPKSGPHTAILSNSVDLSSLKIS